MQSKYGIGKEKSTSKAELQLEYLNPREEEKETKGKGELKPMPKTLGITFLVSLQ